MSIPPSSNEPAKLHNRAAWTQLVRQKQRFTRPALDEEFADPLSVLDGSGWLSEGVRGKRLLCLAAGGGRHGPLYAAAGADVTVVDISAAQLELDREVAAERRLKIRTVETSMDELTMFDEGEFEIVAHPVSTCYLPDLSVVYPQIARITRHGGLYISQHKQPASLQADTQPASDGSVSGYCVRQPYYRQGPLPEVFGSLHREAGTLEFLHRWEQLLGLMCRAGFVIEDLAEPLHADRQAAAGTFAHRSAYFAPYVRVKARRRTSDPRLSSIVF
jgi:SAM-dependent methyltransferase